MGCRLFPGHFLSFKSGFLFVNCNIFFFTPYLLTFQKPSLSCCFFLIALEPQEDAIYTEGTMACGCWSAEEVCQAAVAMAGAQQWVKQLERGGGAGGRGTVQSLHPPSAAFNSGVLK